MGQREGRILARLSYVTSTPATHLANQGRPSNASGRHQLDAELGAFPGRRTALVETHREFSALRAELGGETQAGDEETRTRPSAGAVEDSTRGGCCWTVEAGRGGSSVAGGCRRRAGYARIVRFRERPRGAPRDGAPTSACALGSAVEHRLHTAGVGGSNPPARTNLTRFPPVTYDER